MKAKLMLIGLGGLGEVILQFLAREKDLGQIVVCSRNRERGLAKCNLAMLAAIAQGYSPRLSFLPLDLNDKGAVTGILQKESPDIILNTASLHTWWLPDLLPKEPASLLKKAGFGVWLPFHLTLTLKLMQALSESKYSGMSLIAPFPDVINCILDRLHLPATCGVGNLDEVVPKVRLLAAKKLNVPVDEIQVLLVAHHALEAYAFGKPLKETPPYFLRIEHLGKDVTQEVNGERLLFAPYEIPPGRAINYLTAGSTLKLIKALLSRKEVFLHAPSPLGLPGGYPIIASHKGIKVAPIKGISLEQAIALNEQSHRFDGIEKIEPDGTVIFCKEDAEVLRKTLGYDCQKLSPWDSEGRAKELEARFREYVGRFGVTI